MAPGSMWPLMSPSHQSTGAVNGAEVTASRLDQRKVLPASTVYTVSGW
jgi:hypothetical protein